MSSILLIEDDPILGRSLDVNLKLEGHQVRWVGTLRDAMLERANAGFDLVLLDLGLPDGSGLDFLKELRTVNRRTPVVILTARSDEDSAVEGLQAGANDYVRKPFGNRELMARLKIALREGEPAGATSSDRESSYGGIVVQRDRRTALWLGKPIEMNRREFDILSHLISRAESVVTRESLLEALGKDADIFDRTIDSHVSHVRARLRAAGVEAVRISSVYGVGYRLEKR